MDRSSAGGVLAGLIGLAGIAASRGRARGVPFSPVNGGARIGADFPERAGLANDDAPAPRGEMDDFDEFARPDFDTHRVAPEIRAFYEETADHTMTYRATWHRPFRTGARLAAPLTALLQQLNLPAPGDHEAKRLESHFVPLDPEADPRPGARAWVRTDPDTNDTVFVALYAHHDARNERYVNIAAPLPGGNLSTVLHLESFGTDGTGGDGLRLTTRAPGDPGLYLVRNATGFWLPMEQTFTVWPADAAGAPDAPGDGSVAATHEMWLLGRKFLTVTYGIGR